MANLEHRKIVKGGRKAIARWRKEHQGERFDLTHADLYQADLVDVDLTGADLSRAYLAGANLRMANLKMANLSIADLCFDFDGDILSSANLSNAILSMADLSGADLRGVDLSGVNLRTADLSKASLGEANFSGADLAEADFSGAKCGFTIFAGCDLSQCRGLESVKHEAPSSVGIDTIIASFRGAGNRLTPEMETFFLGAGVPREILAEFPRILAQVQYCTCFICYGEPDRAFAEKLHKDLTARGVSCYFFPYDQTPGERTWREIGKWRREAEKMVVLCSAKALIRPGVLKELEEQIDEEPDKMVPVSLDDLWKEDGFRVMRGDRELKPFLLERNYADFSNASLYGKSLERLLKGLKRPQPAKGD